MYIWLLAPADSIKGILLSIVFMLGTKMHHHLYRNNNHLIAAVTIFTLAIAVSSMGAAAAATTAGNATTTTITPSSGGIQLSPQPMLQQRTTTTSMIPINQTNVSATFSGNGTLTLPNTTETINFTINGSGLISLVTQSVQGTETIRTEDGDTATATYYEILKFNSATREGRGIIIAVVHANPTGTLALLNGTIAAGIDDILGLESSSVTLWEWESGIMQGADVSSIQEGSPMNATTTPSSELTQPTNMP